MKNLLFIILFLFGCESSYEFVQPELKGKFKSESIELDFQDDNVMMAKTEYNLIKGWYFIEDDSIDIHISWKKYNENEEFNIVILSYCNKYSLIDDQLILSGLDFELIFYAL